MLSHRNRVLVAVSGGPDSVALLHILLQMKAGFGLRLGVAHLNHGLRGRAADDDAVFVRRMAEGFDLPCHVEKLDSGVLDIRTRSGSWEEAARRERYRFLSQVAAAHHYDKIAVGHHRDDNAELVLMCLLRGSGSLGLAGIRPVREGRIVRPLIRLARDEIRLYLRQNGLSFVTDSSNADLRFLRNRIRHRLLPDLKASFNANLSDSLNRLSQILRAEDEWMEELTRPHFEQALSGLGPGRLGLSIAVLRGLHVALQRRLLRMAIARIKGDLRRIGYAHIEAALNLINRPGGDAHLDLPDRVRIDRRGLELLVGRAAEGDPAAKTFSHRLMPPGSTWIEEIGCLIELSTIGREMVPEFCQAGQRTAFFDKDRITFPLTLRNFQPGDRFSPLGLTGSQKVKKFLINNKVPRADRLVCPMLLSREKIIWVVGYRIDHSVRIRPTTRRILKVELVVA